MLAHDVKIVRPDQKVSERFSEGVCRLAIRLVRRHRAPQQAVQLPETPGSCIDFECDPVEPGHHLLDAMIVRYEGVVRAAVAQLESKHGDVIPFWNVTQQPGQDAFLVGVLARLFQGPVEEEPGGITTTMLGGEFLHEIYETTRNLAADDLCRGGGAVRRVDEMKTRW